MKWLSLLTGILFIVLGFIMLGTPVANIVSLSVILCTMLIISGILEIIAYFSFDKKFRSGWVLASGILTTIIGLWLFFNGGISALAVTLPYIFSIGLIINSIMMAINSFDLKDLGISLWKTTLFMGIIGTILGFLLVSKPVSSMLTLSFTLAFIFIYRGISNIVYFFTTK